MTRRAARIDGNHTAIVDALRAVGCSVQSLAKIGEGCPDLLVGYRNANIVIEVKDGSLPPSAQKLTPAQKTWHAGWKGRAHLVRNVEEALLVVGATARNRARVMDEMSA